MESPRGDERPQAASPTIWPVGFAVGIAIALVGLVVSWWVVAGGAAVAIVFGFLWARELTRGVRAEPVEEIEPERRARPAAVPVEEAGLAEPEPARYPRSVFLEGATLGVGGIIGGIATLPALGFAIIPPFLHQRGPAIDVGPIGDFPQGEFVITTFLSEPKQGEVSRRTAYIRNNGMLNGVPSFTVISNRCTHLGCPVQPNGPVFDKQAKDVKVPDDPPVHLIPTKPAGFGCPCHGSQFDTEGNRTAGPAVRSLDRYEFSIRDGRLYLGTTFSVAQVQGQGADAKIVKYGLAGPGQHVDGPEAWLYPGQPPH